MTYFECDQRASLPALSFCNHVKSKRPISLSKISKRGCLSREWQLDELEPVARASAYVHGMDSSPLKIGAMTAKVGRELGF